VVAFPQVCPPKLCTCLSPPPIRATCPVHLILLDFITRTILGGQCLSLSFPLCTFLHSPVTSSLLGPNILLNTLFSNTLSLSYSQNISNQVHKKIRSANNGWVLCQVTVWRLATYSLPAQMLLTSKQTAIMNVPVRREQPQQQWLTVNAILQKEIT